MKTLVADDVFLNHAFNSANFALVPAHKIEEKEIYSIGRHYLFNEDEVSYLFKNGYAIRYIRPCELFLLERGAIVLFNEEPSKLNEFLLQDYLVADSEKYDFYSLHTFMNAFLHKNFIPPSFCIRTFFYNNKIKGFPSLFSMVKRSMDIFFSIIGLSILCVIFPFIALIIKIQSQGPIFFVQKRVGINGKEFDCLKFRTMHVNNDEALFSAGSEDSRIFPFAHFMRKTRIDEFPQFLNVLLGEMSLIGPRPERRVWTEQFEKTIPYYNKRHLVKPGITGLAQVLYRYGANEYDAKQKLMYDLYYIEEHSAWLEIRIFFKTITVILNRKGK